jgi:hypothetical protein
MVIGYPTRRLRCLFVAHGFATLFQRPAMRFHLSSGVSSSGLMIFIGRSSRSSIEIT